jgi:DNA-binding PadR family transcriptional regulator
MTMSTDPRSFLPLTPLVFQVMLTLADEPRHGYGIIREVEERTDGVIRLRTGTLYALLPRLLEQGLLAESAERAAEGDDERRRYYEITTLGHAVLKAEARRLELALEDARRKHVLGRAGKA